MTSLTWLGLDAERLQGLDRMGERADVAALAHVLPGVVVGDGAVGVEFQRHFGQSNMPMVTMKPPMLMPTPTCLPWALAGFGLGLVRVVDGLAFSSSVGIDVLAGRGGC